MNKFLKGLSISIIILSSTLALAPTASAFQIQTLPSFEVKNDFVLSPGRVELVMDKGGSATKELAITNRLDSEMIFNVQLEDFAGTKDLSNSLVLLGDQKGPYSLKDFIQPEVRQFSLKPGEKMILPVNVTIPIDARAGGLYGAVIFSTQPKVVENQGQNINAVSRLGALFYVRVNGDVKEDGRLQSFTTDRSWYEKGPIPYSIVFANNSNVHLAPYGKIEISNLLGRKVGEVTVDPFFVLPDSLKQRQVKWDKGFLLGRYTATVFLNRGYGDIIDYQTVTFWVLPWKILTPSVLVLVLIIWLIYWMLKNFKITRKSSVVNKTDANDNDVQN